MSKVSFGLGATLGALAGAAAAYLMAPQSGKEFQEEMKVKAKETKKKAILRMDEAVLETEMWLDQQLTEQDIRDEPIQYERTPDNTAPAPTYTESPEVFIDEDE